MSKELPSKLNKIVKRRRVETRRASSVSNSNFFNKTEGLRVKDGG